ncbi:DNA/RNA non-specific endonuclease [Butyrivibrio sp. MC2013]|uniref:DNA/RNA non-specific endonuclease n=1 Tax=Butyrivibrio sp. MC2013 TaxID=1280686 RepID=UPI00040D3E9E|nr:DNA/RNA non-specific endonuclease [Butyrivibrio sp. MC2013]
MEKYVTQRQRQEKKIRRLKRIIFAIVIAFLFCVVAYVVSLRVGNFGVRLSTTNTSGSESLVNSDPSSIPDYFGEDYVILNGGSPCFNHWDVENITGEHYSELDSKGRCGEAYAMLDRTMMPTEKRGEIGQIKPTGWVQRKYEGIVDSNPPYLYNRCHLIAYALTGQNANELNLITGTRYMNVELMLPWEEKVMSYLDNSDNHVLYRVTPYFKSNELLARGVEMEAYSVEDNGDSICFHVFIYNVQPGIEIDYNSGESEGA